MESPRLLIKCHPSSKKGKDFAAKVRDQEHSWLLLYFERERSKKQLVKNELYLSLDNFSWNLLVEEYIRKMWKNLFVHLYAHIHTHTNEQIV